MLNQPVAIVQRRQSGSSDGTPSDRCHTVPGHGGTGTTHTGPPPPTTPTLADRMAACLAEGQAVQGRLLAADRAGDMEGVAAHHDRLNALTKEYLRLAKEAGEY